MNFLQDLQCADEQAFLFLNGIHSAFFDPIMYWASDKLVWIPFYAWLLYLVYKHFRDKLWYILLFTALLITASDQVASGIIKPLVHRLRPCHNSAIADLIHLTTKGCGGQYGFISSHAANAFALASYLTLLFQDTLKWLKFVLWPWAILIAYSRIYNGVHYPGDVLVAAVIGILLGIAAYRLLNKLGQKPNLKSQKPAKS